MMEIKKSLKHPDHRDRRRRHSRGRDSSKPSSLNKTRMNATPILMPKRQLRRSSFRKLLRGSFLVVIFAWNFVVYQIFMTTTPDSTLLIDARNPVVDNENQQFDTLSSMLIVGGSDGSGTRAFVETLRELGTLIISEDPETFDVHASEIVQGWPGLIRRIFLLFGRKGFFSTEGRPSPKLDSNPIVASSNDTSISSFQSQLVANYEWPPQKMDSYSKDYKKDTKRVEADAELLLRSWNTRYSRETAMQKLLEKRHHHQSLAFLSTSRGFRVQATKMYPDAVANDITYAIKAPISMLALPVFAASYLSFQKEQRQPPRPLKFLHVIRDGRDVALSDNQSPVIKFYDLTYPKQIRDHESLRSKFSASFLHPEKKLDRMYARAMQLWNDWNLVVHRWATDHSINNRTARSQSNDDAPVVDYLLVRSEDLLVPGSQARLDVLTAMAKFVGSSLTPEELCCLSRQDTKDHGKSHSTSANAANKTLPRNAKLQRISASKRGKAMTSTQAKANPLNPAEFFKDYDNWKSFVNSALLAKTERKIKINHLIRQGEEFLAFHRWQNMNTTTMNEIPSEVEILDALKKLKTKFGHRRLLANEFGDRYTNETEIEKNYKNRNQNNNTSGAYHPMITKRYGKWQRVLKNKTELSYFFHRQGAEGLQVFGYHPYRRMHYTEQYDVDDERDGDNNTKSSKGISGGNHNYKPIMNDEEEEDGTTPGICEVSIACPS
jgi:hypothetical protein